MGRGGRPPGRGGGGGGAPNRGEGGAFGRKEGMGREGRPPGGGGGGGGAPGREESMGREGRPPGGGGGGDGGGAPSRSENESLDRNSPIRVMAVCSDTGCDKDSSVKRSSNTGVKESFAAGQKQESGY